METKTKNKLDKNKIVIFRVTENQFNLLNEMAAKHEQKRSEFVRYHFMNLLNSYKNER